MNERIRELIKQAGGEFWQRLENDVVNKEAFVTFDPPQSLEKFAELVVQECIDYMNYRTKDWDAKLRWIFNDGSGYMDVDVDSLLKEHFGVEREASKKD